MYDGFSGHFFRIFEILIFVLLFQCCYMCGLVYNVTIDIGLYHLDIQQTPA